MYATTDAQGWAGFTKLDPERGYVLRVEPPDDRDDLAWRYLPAWHPRATQELQLAPFETVTGTVQDDAGTPAAGVRVWVMQSGEFGEWRHVVAAADGTFTIPRLRPGAVTLVASDDVDTTPDLGETPGVLHTTTRAAHIVLLLARGVPQGSPGNR